MGQVGHGATHHDPPPSQGMQIGLIWSGRPRGGSRGGSPPNQELVHSSKLSPS